MSVLSVRGLRKSYGALEVVAGVELEIEPGECFGLLGPNGAGKTTTLKLCLGLIEPDAGTIELLGEPVPRRAREARTRVGVVPQFDNLDPDFTATENLLVYARYFGLSGERMRERVPRLLEFAGLGARADARINTLSGGMKRRLTLARGLVNDPQLVVMDEPTTGLDPQARHLIWERLRRLTAEGKTLLLTTHFIASPSWTRAASSCRARPGRSSPSTSSRRWWRCTGRGARPGCRPRGRIARAWSVRATPCSATPRTSRPC